MYFTKRRLHNSEILRQNFFTADKKTPVLDADVRGFMFCDKRCIVISASTGKHDGIIYEFQSFYTIYICMHYGSAYRRANMPFLFI